MYIATHIIFVVCHNGEARGVARMKECRFGCGHKRLSLIATGGYLGQKEAAVKNR